MKAWRLYGFSDMRLDDLAEPEPQPGWVKVKIRVAQPSITETLLFKGVETFFYTNISASIAKGPAQHFGHEFSGEVVELGPGVTTLEVGDRVAARGSHPAGIVGIDYPGAFAEYIVVPEDLLARMPDHVSDSEGAAIQPLTDAVAAVHAADVTLGDTVVVIGQGAMGLCALQAARAGGAGKLIAVAKRDEVLDMSRRLGADVVINTTKEDPVEAVRELTKGTGADVVIETAGGPPDQGLAGDKTLIQAAEMLRDHGKIVGIALHGEGTFLPYATFRYRSIRYKFPSVLDQKLFEATVGMVASGQVNLKPLITHVLDGIEKVPEAFELTANKPKYGLINPAQVVISN